MVSAALVSGGLIGCNKPKDADTLISEAKNYQQKGDDKAAVIQLKNALQENPNNPEARYLLGLAYNKIGDLQSAEKELRKALNLGMSPDKVLPDLGLTLLSLGQFQQVLDETKILSDKQNSAEISTLRGNALLALGKAEDAKNSFERALAAKPDFGGALIGLARYSLLKNDLQTATQYSEQAVARNPENPDTWFFKADLLRIKGEVDPALAAYDQVLKLKPNSSLAYLNKAFIEIGAGKLDSAKTNIEAARKVAPGNGMILYAQALLDYTQGSYPAALESVQQILSKAPEHLPSILLAGAVQLALGSSIQAEQHLKHYLEKDPKNLYARKLLASALLKNRQPGRAIEVLTPALKDTQQDSQLFALAGEAYMQSRNFAKATEYFEKGSTLSPQSALLHTALSMSKMGQGENDRAVAELEIATKLNPKLSQAGILLIMTHLRNRQYDKALAAAQGLEKEQPDNPLVYNLKGGIYLNKKDMRSARASFEKALSVDPAYFPAIVNLAELDLLEKKPDAAKERFKGILVKDKKNIQAMTALSALALSQGESKEATQWLERASNENPDSLQPALALGSHYLRSGEKQKALALAKKLQGIHPHDTGMLELLAQAEFANGNKAAALESYNKLAVAMPESALAQLHIASVHMAMENRSAASEALKKALAIKPDYLDAQLAQIALESQQGNYDKAIMISRQIQEQQGKSPVGYIAEGDLLMMYKKPALAAAAYERAFAINKNQSILVKLHGALLESGKAKEANSRLFQWLKEHPADTPIRMYLAQVYLGNRENKPAIEQYQAILRQDSKYIPALNNLATAYHQEKDPLALEYAEKAYHLAPDNPSILDTLGWILVEQGDIARGLPLLQKAISLAPETAEIRYHFAAGLAKSGEKTQARKELERLLRNGEQFASVNEARLLLKQIQ